MILDSGDLEKLSRVAAEAARRAGTMIQEAVGKDRAVGRKEGGESLASQVVTEVDLESERIIFELLEETREEFGLGLLTEESEDDASRHECDYFWCVDPLDGTLPFTEGIAGYAVSIGLVSRAGEAVIGVIVDPVTGTTYRGWKGGGAFRNEEPWSVLEGREGDGLTFVMDRSFAEQANYAEIKARVEAMAEAEGLRAVRVIDRGGAAMNACRVVEEAPAVYFKFPKATAGGGSLWDYAASACLFRELGAAVSDFRGEPLKLNRRESTFMNTDGILYASSTSLAAALREIFPGECE